MDALIDGNEASEDDDLSLSEYEEEFTCEELLDLAQQIDGLNLPEISSLFADRMLACKNGYYSRSFYETAIQMEYLKDGGMSFEDAARELAGRIPAVEDLSFELEWGKEYVVRKYELVDYAAAVHKLGLNGPDGRLAKRIIGTKAAKGDWKLIALRYHDIERRLNVGDYYNRAFYEDQKRVDKEFAELRKNIRKVVVRADAYCMPRPMFPPWRDIEKWSKYDKVKGYGIDYELRKKQNSPAVASLNAHRPGSLNALFAHLANRKDFASAGKLHTEVAVEVEDGKMEVENQNVLEDRELHNVLPVQPDDNLALVPFQHAQENIVEDEVEDLEDGHQNVQEGDTIDENEVEVVTVDPNMLSDDDQSDAEEAARIMDEMGIITTGEQLSPGTYQICDASEHREGMAVGNIVSTDAHATATVFQLSSTEKENISSIEQTASATEQISANTDMRKEATFDPPTTFDKEFPLLPTQKTAAQEQNKSAQNRGNNVWVDRSKKRPFMNVGLGGKLERNDITSPSFHIDVDRAFSIKDIWGYSLLGQYVGHHPGHFLINSMIKGWGVKAKYKMEEGWFIFNFNTQEDQEKVLLGGPYLIHGRPMILKYIPDKFAFNKRDVAKVPLWVRIYGLASRFWTVENLGGIASYIGNPLYMDPVTESRKRNAYARVLVEINLAAEVTRKVPITFSDGDSIEVNFLVENEPKFCPECCSFGHDIKECNFNKKKAMIGVKDKIGIAQPQLNFPSSDHQATAAGTHKSSQENISTSMQATAGHNQEVLWHNRDKNRSTEEQQNTQHKSVQKENYEQNLRTISKQHRVWIEKKKEHQENATDAGRQGGISGQTGLNMHDDSSSHPQGTAKNIPLSNRFDPLQATECTNEERGGESVMTAMNSTHGISPTHQTRSSKQPATVT